MCQVQILKEPNRLTYGGVLLLHFVRPINSGSEEKVQFGLKYQSAKCFEYVGNASKTQNQ